MALELYLTACAMDRFKKGFEEGRKEGFEEGYKEWQEIIALKMIRKGKSLDEISDLTEVPIKRLKELAENPD